MYTVTPRIRLRSLPNVQPPPRRPITRLRVQAEPSFGDDFALSEALRPYTIGEPVLVEYGGESFGCTVYEIDEDAMTVKYDEEGAQATGATALGPLFGAKRRLFSTEGV